MRQTMAAPTPTPVPQQNFGFESAAARLLNDASQRLQIATDLRERIEIVNTREFGNFLKHLFPAFKVLIRERVQPQFVDNNGNKFRNIVLEILNRLPNNDVMRPYVPDLLQLSMEVRAGWLVERAPVHSIPSARACAVTPSGACSCTLGRQNRSQQR